MNERVERLRASLEEPLLVTTGVNVRYLSGFESTNAALLVAPDRVVLYTDFRYAEAARALEGVELVETRRSLSVHLAELLSGTIAFEPDGVSFAQYQTLAAGGLELVPRPGAVEALRAVKDEEELAAIRAAAEIADRVYERLADERFTGHTERDLSHRIEQLFWEHGAEQLAFPVIVASGPNAAQPHAHPGGREIELRETVIVDAGCTMGGYCSDCTRTFATGPLPEDLHEAYAVCLQGQEAGLAAVAPGKTGIEVDGAARQVIAGAGLGEAFGHGLGHGVGLLVHEAPRLAPESADTLAAGNVVTVEPGIYLPGRGGIRIEDLVVVRDEEPEVLSRVTKNLITVN
jgi:Xaa-Pro aminopeptidase